MAVELAASYVSLVPSAKGLGDKLAKAIDGPMNKASKDAGKSGGKALTAEFNKQTSDLRSEAEIRLNNAQLSVDLGKARADVTKITKAISNAPVGLDTSDLVRDLAKAQSLVESKTKEMSRNKATLSLDPGPMDKGLDKASTNLFDTVGGWASAGPLIALAAGAGIAAALLDGFNTVLDRGRSSDKLAAQLGIDGAASARLGKIAGQIFVDNFGESFDQVNEAIRSVGVNKLLQGWASDADIKAVTEQLLNFIAIFGGDVPRVTAAVSQLLRTGLAKNAEEAFDILTRGAQLGADKADDLLDTFNEYPTAFRKLGLDGATAMGIIVQGLQGGARDSDIVADAFKELGIRAIDSSALTAQGFTILGLSADKMAKKFAAGGAVAAGAVDEVLDRLRGMKDPIAQNTAAVALFGTQAEDMGATLFSIDPSGAVSALGTVAGAATAAGTTINDNLGSQLDSIKRKLDPANLLATASAEGLGAAKDQAAAGIAEISALWDQYGPQVKSAIDEGWTALQGWWDEHGQEIIDKAKVFWDTTGQPAMGELFGTVLEGAWHAAWNRLVDVLTDPSNIVSMVAPIGKIGDNLAKTIVNGFIGVWNDFHFDLPKFDLPGGHSIGGNRIDTPDLEPLKMHSGGVVPGGPSAEVLTLLQGGERVITADQQRSSGLNVGGITVYGQPDPYRTAQEVVMAQRRAAALRRVA